MKKAGIPLLATLALAYVAAIVIPYDPQDRRPGTRLSGEVADGDGAGWQALSAEPRSIGSNLIQVETRPWYLVRHSVTTTSATREGEFYVPCRDCANKRWPRNVEADPRVRVKVDGVVYDRVAVRVTDDLKIRRLFGVAEGEPTPTSWLFRMDPPAD